MITIYHSNKIEILIKSILKIINTKQKKKILEKETIIIPNKDIEEWLNIKFSNYNEISANFSFQTINKFIFNKILKNNPKKNYFKKSVISWNLAKIFPFIIKKKKFQFLKKYLHQKNKTEKLHQLTDYIADLFYQYLLYRPNWIKKWNNNQSISNISKNQKWQKYLWILLNKEINKKILPIDSSKKTKIKKKQNLPKRIFFFNITEYPPLYFKILNKIKKNTKIYLLFFNPSQYYYFNFPKKKSIKHTKNKNKKLQNQLTKEKLLENPLINFLEKKRKKILYMIYKIKEIKEKKIFINQKKKSLLQKIQSDIFNLENHIKIGLTNKEFFNSSFKRKLKKKDQSITFHSCHDKKTEIINLKNFLIKLFKKNKKITPKDIIIMAPNINKYKNYINNIFSKIHIKKSFSFKILDQNFYKKYPILKTFLLLLNLPKIRFKSNQIFKILENSEIHHKFKINQKEIGLLKKWISESKIRWGIDNKHINSFNLPKIKQNTWHHGIKKILLGNIMEKTSQTWKKILPYNIKQEISQETLKKFLKFFKSLTKWKKILDKKKTLKKWIPICKFLLKDFFLFNTQNRNAFSFIIKQWKKIIYDGILIEYNKTIPMSIIQQKIKKIFDKRNNEKFFSGSLNFCTINPNRQIPFKITCLLGMNNNLFPRFSSKKEFNLIHEKPKYEDINKNNNENYLFLETLILTSKKIYISFFKNNIKNNKKYTQSILIEKFINYISYSFYLEGDQSLNLDESAKKIRNHLITKHKKLSIFQEKKETKKKIKKNSQIKSNIKKKQKKIQFCKNVLKKNKKNNLIFLKDLLLFYKNPTKMFFQKKLKTNFEIQKTQLQETESFSLNYIEKYQINTILLKKIMKKNSTKKILDTLMATGLFPTKNFAKIYLEKKQKKLINLIKEIKKKKKNNFNKSFSFSIKKNTITGKLKKIQKNGILRYKPKKLTIIDGFSLWIEHLIFCLIIQPAFSFYLGFDKTTWCFKPIKQKKAKKYLKKIITGYKIGTKKPFPLFFYSSWQWILSCYDKKKNFFDFKTKKILKKAEKKLISSITGKYNFYAEMNNIYNKRAFNTINKNLIKSIKKNALKYLFPIIKFKQ